MYQQLFETLFSQCSQALLHCDARGHIVAANEIACKLLGDAAEVLVGSSLEHLFASDNTALQAYLVNMSEDWRGHVRYRDVRLSLTLTRVCDDAGETVLVTLEPAFKQLSALPLSAPQDHPQAHVFGHVGRDSVPLEVDSGSERSAPQLVTQVQAKPPFDPLSLSVFHVDREWRVTYLNDVATKTSKNPERFTPEAVLGRSLWQLLPYLNEADNPFAQAYRYAMATDEPVYVEGEVRDADLSSQVRCTYIIPTGDGLLVHGLDTTEHKRAAQAIAQALQEREVMFNSIADYVLMLDQHWRFIYANDAAQQLHPQGFIGKPYFDVFATGTLCEEKYRHVFKTKRPAYFEAQSHLDGTWMEMRVFPSGDNIIIYGVDITERKQLAIQLEQALSDKENILNSITDDFIVLDNDWRFVYANRHVLAKTPNIVGKHYFEVFPDNRGTIFEDKYHQAFATRQVVKFEAVMTAGKRWGEVRVYPNREGIAIFSSDIDDRKRLEEKLEQALADKEAILNSITDSVIVLDHDWRFVYANENALRFTPGVVGKSYWDVFPHNRGTVFERCYQQVLDTGNPVRFTTKTTQRGIWTEVRVFPSPEGIAVYVADISELKAKEAALERALAAKEMLVKEVHHRTKNNMQLISSMLSIQMHGLKDEDSRRAIADSRNRINVLADVHKLMYQQLDSETINTDVHLGGLLQKLAHSMTNRAVTVNTDIDAVELTIHQAIPVGLIVNELFTNVLKHAFPEPSSGDAVVVRLWLEREQVVLELADNGRGLPRDFDMYQDTLGMTIVQSLVGQLGGTWSLTNGDASGTVAQVRFNKENGQPED